MANYTELWATHHTSRGKDIWVYFDIDGFFIDDFQDSPNLNKSLLFEHVFTLDGYKNGKPAITNICASSTAYPYSVDPDNPPVIQITQLGQTPETCETTSGVIMRGNYKWPGKDDYLVKQLYYIAVKAYNPNDERLLVKGNAHVKRQLKVDGDIYQETNKEAVLPNITSSSIALGDGVVRKIDSDATSGNVTYDATNQKFVTSNDLVLSGNLEANEIKANADVDVQGELIARKDLSVSGDLYVNGTEHINDTETAQTSDDYLVLRHNKTTALGANEHAGVVIHNYMPNKTATLTTDNTGTWRVADNTETDTNYSAISYYNGTYYNGLGQATTVTVIDGIKSAWDEDELDECVFYNNGYYHFDGTNYFAVELSGNVMVLGAMVTDPDVITALQALTGNDLVYFRSLTVTTISEVENEPLLTRDEASNLSDGDVLAWDATGEKAVAATGVAKTSDITDAINALDVTDTAVAGQYVSSVSQVDGEIVVTRDNLPVSKELDWDNAILCGVGDLRSTNTTGSSITVCDINGNTHVLASGGSSFNVSWNIPKKGKLFSLGDLNSGSNSPHDSKYVSSSGVNYGSLSSHQLGCTKLYGGTRSAGALASIFTLKDSQGNTKFTWNTPATSAISSASANPANYCSVPATYEIGVECEAGDKVSTAGNYPSSQEPQVHAITGLAFVPYKG